MAQDIGTDDRNSSPNRQYRRAPQGVTKEEGRRDEFVRVGFCVGGMGAFESKEGGERGLVEDGKEFSDWDMITMCCDSRTKGTGMGVESTPMGTLCGVGMGLDSQMLASGQVSADLLLVAIYQSSAV